jgi:hypothetical protein
VGKMHSVKVAKGNCYSVFFVIICHINLFL